MRIGNNVTYLRGIVQVSYKRNKVSRHFRDLRSVDTWVKSSSPPPSPLSLFVQSCVRVTNVVAAVAVAVVVVPGYIQSWLCACVKRSPLVTHALSLLLPLEKETKEKEAGVAHMVTDHRRCCCCCCKRPATFLFSTRGLLCVPPSLPFLPFSPFSVLSKCPSERVLT